MNKDILYLLLLIVSISSCTKKLPLPSINSDKKIVLLGELTAEERPYLRSGQTIGINTNGSAQIDLLKDIAIKIADESGNESYLSGNEDSLSQALQTIPFTGNMVLQPRYTYTVTATHNKLGIATVNVPIPQPFSAKLIDIAETQYAGEDVIKFTIQIDDPAGEDQYSIECVKQKIDIKGEFQYKGKWLDIVTNIFIYDSLKNANQPITARYDTTFYNVFNREFMFTSDANSENVKENTTTYAYRRVLLGDNSFNSQSYTTQIFVRKGYSSALFNGQLVIMIKSVSKDYFNYLNQYEGIAGYNYTSSNIPATLKGNINNGLGIVGGVYKRQFSYVADEIFPY